MNATKSRLLTLVCGLSLLVPGVFGLRVGAPTFVWPAPYLTIVPAFLLGGNLAAAFVPALLFFMWSPGLFQSDGRIPKRSYGLLAVATALSAVWFVAGWRYSLEHHGAGYTHFVCATNVAWIAALWAMFIRQWKSAPSFKANLFLHWALFAWLGWHAFPWLGELG